MKWYADNSELMGIREAAIPDILLFGGIVTTPDSEQPLRKEIEQFKHDKFGKSRVPIKWNFKDLRNFYKKRDEEKLYEEMLKTSKKWRLELVQKILSYNFKIIVSCIQSHSISKDKIKDVKEDLARYVFSNGLMRYALIVRDERVGRAQVILDWPDSNKSKPFDSEYAFAFNTGKSCDNKISYFSGPLKEIGFCDSVTFTNMMHSTILQLSDLLVGATREVIECALGKKQNCFGFDILKEVKGKFYGYPDKIYGRGISVGSGDGDYRKCIKNFVQKHLN